MDRLEAADRDYECRKADDSCVGSAGLREIATTRPNFPRRFLLPRRRVRSQSDEESRLFKILAGRLERRRYHVTDNRREISRQYQKDGGPWRERVHTSGRNKNI